MKNEFDFSPFYPSHISVNGNKSAVIDGCRQILESSEIMVRILSGCYEIQLWGKSLKLTFFTQGTVEVRGTIEEIKIESKVGKINAERI